MARILIVDDDKNLRASLRRNLTRLGYEIIEAENGREAISLYLESSVDVVITDILMPEKDGLELIRELKKTFEDAKIIAITGGSNKYNAPLNFLTEAKIFGAQHVFEKPFTTEQLVSAIKELLGHSSEDKH